MHFAVGVPARWRALPARSRIAIAIVASVVLAVAIAFGVAAHPPRVALFAGALHPEQLSEVQERLAGWNVAFTPTADNVIVDAAARNDLLLRLSLAGVPHPHVSGTGEALANVGVLTPEAVVEAQTRTGLAGDVEAGLRGVAGVDDARVIIAPAKTPEFADQSAADATASVRLQMRAGERLSTAEVSGIRAFVAAAVPGLATSHVTIVDDRGVMLDDDAGSPDDAADMQRSLQTALDAALGDGTTIVRVHAEYGSTGTSQRDVRRGPLGAQPIARTERDERYDDGAKRYRRRDATDDRGSEVRETLTQVKPGSLKRLSTAVFVDENHALELAKVRDLAAATVGYDPRRGDTLAVEAVDFHRAVAPRKDWWWLMYGVVVPLAPAIAIAFGIVVATRLALPPLTALLQAALERLAHARTSKEVAGMPPARVRSALAHEPAHAAAAIISALPAATAAAVLDMYPAHERDAIVKRMQRPQSPLLADAQELLRRHA